MKTNITITIDEEIAKKLRAETNFSNVINEQMKGYYDVKKIEDLEFLNEKLSEIKQILKKNRKKRREIEDTIAKITQKRKNFKLKLKKQGLTRAKLIKQIEARRKSEQSSHRRVTYYITAEEEADTLLKGGAK